MEITTSFEIVGLVRGIAVYIGPRHDTLLVIMPVCVAPIPKLRGMLTLFFSAEDTRHYFFSDINKATASCMLTSLQLVLLNSTLFEQ